MGSDPQTEALWDDLLVLLEDGKVIPIVGRDLLEIGVDGRRIRLYDHLAVLLADRLGVDMAGLPTEDPLNGVACRYIEQGGRSTRIYTTLKTIMPGPDTVELPEALVKLAGIRPLTLFVSTTFDPLLETTLNRIRYGGRGRTGVLSYSPRDVQDLSLEWRTAHETTLFHLLGRVSATPDYAVTEADILEFMHVLQSETRRPAVLFDEMRQQQLLLIGCSFPDWLTRFLVRVAQGDRGALRDRSDFVADDTVRGDGRLVYFLTKFGGCQVFPTGAAAFVDELYARWTSAHPEASPAPVVESPIQPEDGDPARDMVDGAIFLSYASEDRATVERLTAELESQGLDVWFDRQDLRGGDDFETKIRRNIRRASLFVAVISGRSLVDEPRFFRKEWKAALDRADMFPEDWPFILPVAIDGTRPESAQGLPEKFTALHWLRLPDGRCTDEFLTTVRDAFRRVQRMASA